MRDLQVIRSHAFKSQAVLVGERIDLRINSVVPVLATNPLTISRSEGVIALYRHGVVVFFNVSQAEQAAFLSELAPLITNAYSAPETESLDILVEAGGREGVTAGVATLEDTSVERLQIVADVLGKSALLSLYERSVAGEFDGIEPLAADLGRSGRVRSKSKDLLKKLGAMMLVEQRMVGRAEIDEKPDTLWDHPRLEGLFARLEAEFEITDRHIALERKLNMISQTAHTVLDLLTSKHALRVEWYIVVLIVLEILLTLYQRFVH
ncbi:MAG: RMD1 family protein [Betaproteobacteria bacterium]